METLAIQSSSLQSAQLKHGAFRSPMGRSRHGFQCLSHRTTQKKLHLQAKPFHHSPPTKVPTFSITHVTDGRLTEKILSTSDAGQDEQHLLLKKKANELKTDLRGTCIYLIGMMGSGKTTVGRILAEALGYQFFDSDKLVEEAAGGASVAQIFKEQDEKNFRDAETEVLKQLSCMGRLVVATGGGIVVRPINWSYLRYGVTVWLDVPLEALAERVVAVGTESRPLLGPTESDAAHIQALSRLTNIFKDRGPFYADADATVSLKKLAAHLGCKDVRDLTPTMIAIQVLEEIKKLIVSKKQKDAASAA